MSNPEKPPSPADRLGRYMHDLRVSVIDQCNFRCAYCMPAEIFGPDYAFLKKDQLLSFPEISRLARIFGQLGVEKIRLTGGEPLLRKDLHELIAALVQTPGIADIALTTNGVLLPRFADALFVAGLHRITVSLDALDDAVFAQMNGRSVPVQKVLDGIDAAAAAGFSIKVNMVVEKGVNDGEIPAMARYFRDRGHTLRFIEFMDVGNHNGWRLDKVCPAREIVDRLAAEFPVEPVEPDYRGEVANRYRYTDTGGEFGVIASVTQPFCRDCTRARLAADGRLYTCLFATEGWDLREILRENATDADILAFIRDIWIARTDRYSERRTEILRKHLHPHKVEMSYIGG